ncbi:SDR family NAD(P)-dependent oxidoreductase [Sulfuritalea sp.]|uniref:SDR family NAD(P)-dependent oxidoreductase n=1 Tax=Sulfuritalea sp. TaxID=2480090 RepID=UPI001AC70DB9|nr:SDR family NAD(P)-dependent oxidoreductase [Sulfuritalea sp.]MBN8477114.1 SDR family NAD(P)-dependent oxidoreductase [Sulfuritalea sp.]
MKEFRGRTAVITGAASGIGLELARRAAAEGMNLVLADIEATKLDAAAASLGIDAGRILAQRTDVSREDEVKALADAAFARFGGVHLLCNNAGVGLTRVSWELSTADWNWVLGVDLWSVIHGIQHFVPRMLQQAEGGHLVNTSSVAGLLSTPGMAAYNVAKHGVVTLSETLYGELLAARAKVGVSVLCPAWVPTAIHESGRNRQERFGEASPAAGLSAAYEQRMASAVKSGRLTAADMANEVFAAVMEERFYVIPHRKINNAIQLRMDDIMNLRNPTQLP